MLSLAEGTKQRATIVTGRRAAETPPPAPPRENWQGRTVDPLSMSIIHDLRNPLAAICVCAEMLTGPNLAPDHAERVGRNIHKAARRMRELLSDLVCVTQGGIAAAENCALHEILAVVCEDAAIAADIQGVDILLDLPARIEMTVLRTRMERVFINLVTNALEAMPGGGVIRIVAKEAGDYALIEVEDSGPGIPPEIYGRLFDLFVTAGKKDGLGLGLALSRRTVRDHGGDMWIEPADGARFVIRMPLTRSICGVQHRPWPKGPGTSIPTM
jgi:two-component system sensor histidine kinase HydH